MASNRASISRDKSWRPEFADALRKYARNYLANHNEASLFCAAFVLRCVGTAQDLPDFIAGFDFAVKEAQGKSRAMERNRRPPGACVELLRAAEMFVDRGVPIADKPKTSGAKVLFVEKINRNKSYRPDGWETTFIGILRDEMNYVREVGLDCCPKPLPDAFKTVILERMRDPDVDVQIAALQMVDENSPPEWKPAVLEAFGKAEDFVHRCVVDQAAYHLCDRLEWIDLYVGLIDDPDKAKDAVEELDAVILRDGRSGSYGTDVDTPAKRQKCKAAWVKFVTENREKLKEKQPFSVNDPIPIDDLFPGITFSSRKSLDKE